MKGIAEAVTGLERQLQQASELAGATGMPGVGGYLAGGFTTPANSV